MATSDEKKALGFLLLLAMVGAGVRWAGVARFERDVLRRPGGQGTSRGTGDASIGADGAQRALAAQLSAIDSVRRTGKAARAPRKTPSKGRSPRSPPAASGTAGGDAPPEPPPRIDVNAASAAELERLPRVGPALAQRIVAYRNQHGPFESPEALRHVRGIGPSTVRLLEPLVTFSGRHRP